MIQIKEITAPEAYSIRKEVLRDNIPTTEKMDGDFDESTIHLGAFLDGKLACVATFMQHDSPHFKDSQYRLRGMATDKSFQKQGFGIKILDAAAEKLRERGVRILWCNARIIAIDFYKKSGFEIIGEEFDVHLIGPHYVMFKNLNHDT